MSKRIYLDNNAGTFIDPRVADEIVAILKEPLGNPSSTHSFGQKARNQLSKARNTIASFLGTKASEIVFTSGGTEGMNFLIRGILAQQHSGHVITSSVEHSCVNGTLKSMEASGFTVSFLPPGLYGAITAEAVHAALRPDTSLICLMAVNNETGVKTDLEAIAAIADEKKIPMIVDGVAMMGKEIFSIPKGISAMSFSGHKFHAPQGIGFSFIRSGLKLSPLLTGGGHEFGKRAGTENILGILSLAKAVELLKEELPMSSKHMLDLRERFEGILHNALANVSINGQGPRVCNVSNIAFSGVDGESLLLALDAAGVAASHGSACSSGALEPSRILLNMGIPQALVRSSLRFSFSHFTTEQEIDEACTIIIKLVNHLSY
ncbi:MAG: cysteine desulfurase [Parachlamydiaceae bacterium]|nr:cysteine desulfurase [Parachlamydiaceae bacterium]